MDHTPVNVRPARSPPHPASRPEVGDFHRRSPSNHRISQAETKRLLAQENDPTRPLPDITFETGYTLLVGGQRVELAWHGTNHTADNSYIHFPESIRLDLGVGSQVHP
jgi:hypothetical protein